MAKKDEPRRIYCSGPLFSPEERWAMDRIAEVLEGASYDTFLPQRDGLEGLALGLSRAPGAQSRLLDPASALMRRAIFALDVYQVVEGCDGLVCNLDGRVPDEGAVVEVSIAFSIGKPLVLYKADDRTSFSGWDNPMITGLTRSFTTVSDIDRLPREMRAALSAGRRDPVELGRELARVVAFGREVWRLLALVRREPKEHWAAAAATARLLELLRGSADSLFHK